MRRTPPPLPPRRNAAHMPEPPPTPPPRVDSDRPPPVPPRRDSMPLHNINNSTLARSLSVSHPRNSTGTLFSGHTLPRQNFERHSSERSIQLNPVDVNGSEGHGERPSLPPRTYLAHLAHARKQSSQGLDCVLQTCFSRLFHAAQHEFVLACNDILLVTEVSHLNKLLLTSVGEEQLPEPVNGQRGNFFAVCRGDKFKLYLTALNVTVLRQQSLFDCCILYAAVFYVWLCFQMCRVRLVGV